VNSTELAEESRTAGLHGRGGRGRGRWIRLKDGGITLLRPAFYTDYVWFLEDGGFGMRSFGLREYSPQRRRLDIWQCPEIKSIMAESAYPVSCIFPRSKGPDATGHGKTVRAVLLLVHEVDCEV